MQPEQYKGRHRATLLSTMERSMATASYRAATAPRIPAQRPPIRAVPIRFLAAWSAIDRREGLIRASRTPTAHYPLVGAAA